MRKEESKRSSYFSDDMVHKTVEEFTVAYFNNHIKVDRGKSDKLRVHNTSYQKPETERIWEVEKDSYGYYTIRYVDQRFDDLNELIDKHSGRIEMPESERPLVKKRLYALIMLLLRERRIDGPFKLQPHRDSELRTLTAEVAKVVKLIANHEERIEKLETLANRGAISP